jgi:hypothetical protein
VVAARHTGWRVQRARKPRTAGAATNAKVGIVGDKKLERVERVPWDGREAMGDAKCQRKRKGLQLTGH